MVLGSFMPWSVLDRLPSAIHSADECEASICIRLMVIVARSFANHKEPLNQIHSNNPRSPSRCSVLHRSGADLAMSMINGHQSPYDDYEIEIVQADRDLSPIVSAVKLLVAEQPSLLRSCYSSCSHVPFRKI
jgi:hypothetical protein